MIKPRDILLGLTLLAGATTKAEAAPKELQTEQAATREKTEQCLNMSTARRLKEDAPDATQLLAQISQNGLTANLHSPIKPNGHTLVLVNDLHLDSRFDGTSYEALKKAGVTSFAMEGWNGEEDSHLNGQSDFVENVLADPAIHCLGLEKDTLRIDAFLSNLLILELDKIFAEKYLEADIKERHPETDQKYVTMAVEEQKKTLQKVQSSLAESIFLIRAKGEVDASAIQDKLEAKVWLEIQLNEAAQKAGFTDIEHLREMALDKTAWEALHEKLLVWKTEKTVADRNTEATARIRTTYRKNPDLGPTAIWFGEGHRDDLLSKLLAEGFTVLEVKRMQGDDRESLEIKQIEDMLRFVDEIIEEGLKQEE